MHDTQLEVDSVENGKLVSNAPGLLTQMLLLGLLSIGFGTTLSIIVATVGGLWQSAWVQAHFVKDLAPKERIAGGFDICDRFCRKIRVRGDDGKQVTAAEDILTIVFGCTGNPCLINKSPGGSPLVFGLAAKAALLHPDMQIRVVSDCFSACGIFADIARSKVCVEPRARIGFHMGYTQDIYWGKDEDLPLVAMKRFKPKHSPDIDQWVEKAGGYPEVGVNYMYFNDAVKFWKACANIDPAVFDPTSIWMVPSTKTPRANWPKH